MNTAAIIK